DWIRVYRVGGKMRYWGMHCPRWSERDFQDSEALGEEFRWPISYAELAPYYTRFERLMRVAGSAEHLAECPDGHFQGTIPYRKSELGAKNKLERLGVAMTPGRYAIGGPDKATAGQKGFYSTAYVKDSLIYHPKFSLATDTVAKRVLSNREGTAVDGVLVYD